MPAKPGPLRPHEARQNYNRRTPTQPPPGEPALGDSFLIVTEGEVTERLYFESVRTALQLHPVTVRGYIDEGKPSTIRTVNIEGLDEVRPRLAKRLRAVPTVKIGQVFTATDYNSTLTTLRNTLLGDGYAFAEVTGSVDAWAELHRVDVHIVVAPGKRSR